MPVVTLSIDESSYKIHDSAGNRSALYRWALWELHRGNKSAEKAAAAPSTRRRPQTAKKR